jgi:transcriptional regulator with XRE-family HTH domain
MPDRLRKARKARGLGYRSLASLAGVAHTTIQNLEERKNSASLAVTEALAKALEVDPAWLGFGRGEVPDLKRSAKKDNESTGLP